MRFETYQKDLFHIYLSGLGPVECASHLVDLDGKTAAIEGFGAHSVVMAELLEERGAKVIAVSTLSGSLSNSDGIDVDDIRDRWDNHGADFVVGEGEEAEPAWKIFNLEPTSCLQGPRWALLITQQQRNLKSKP